MDADLFEEDMSNPPEIPEHVLNQLFPQDVAIWPGYKGLMPDSSPRREASQSLPDFRSNFHPTEEIGDQLITRELVRKCPKYQFDEHSLSILNSPSVAADSESSLVGIKYGVKEEVPDRDEHPKQRDESAAFHYTGTPGIKKEVNQTFSQNSSKINSSLNKPGNLVTIQLVPLEEGPVSFFPLSSTQSSEKKSCACDLRGCKVFEANALISESDLYAPDSTQTSETALSCPEISSTTCSKERVAEQNFAIQLIKKSPESLSQEPNNICLPWERTTILFDPPSAIIQQTNSDDDCIKKIDVDCIGSSSVTRKGESENSRIISKVCHSLSSIEICESQGKELSNKRPSIPYAGMRLDNDPYSFETCSASFNSTLERNQEAHSNKKQFLRLQCPAVSKDREELKRHGGAPSNSFICQICGKSFKLKITLKAHLKTHKRRRNVPCPHCPKKCKTQAHLSLHQKTHSADKPIFSCAHCPAKFHYKALIRYHLLIHSNDRPYTCNICSSKFKSKSELTSHMKIHAPKREATFHCPHCPIAYIANPSLQYHIKAKHFKDRPYTCNQCKASFVSRGNLTNHLRSHSDARPFPCSICSQRSFKTKRELSIHVKTHSNEKLYTCAHCLSKFKTKRGMKAHIIGSCSNKRQCSSLTSEKNFSFGDERIYSCAHCPATFHYKALIRSHMLTHSNEKPYSCNICPSKFKSEPQLRLHMKIHASKREPTFCCPHCPIAYIGNSSLQYHIKAEHSKDRPYPCTQCKASFVSRGNLKNHLRSHSDARPFPCSVCSQRSFKTKHDLSIHERTHSKEKLYSCAHCLSNFKTKQGMKAHIIGFHSSEKPFSSVYSLKNFCHPGRPNGKIYSCAHGPANFHLKTQLNSHMLIHCNIKLFSCYVCCQKFKTQGKLRIHKKIHPAEKS